VRLSNNQKIGFGVLIALLILSYMIRKKIVTAVNTLSDFLFNTLKSYESIELDPTKKFAVAYWDNIGKVWTIGWGNTYYTDGTKVKQGDKLTLEDADKLFKTIVGEFSNDVLTVVKQPLNNNQYNALVLWAYNVGPAFKTSTLIKKLNVNPNDPSIKDEFLKWNKSKGVFVQGLYNRRQKEAELYFKPV
jgi:lysozyme